MIHDYFIQLEQQIQNLSILRSHTLTHKTYNAKQGFIRGILIFEDGTQLEFVEVKNTDLTAKIKYRYHYMDPEKELIFRYDNAPHYPQMRTFPHHVHFPDEVRECAEPDLSDILLKVAQYIKQLSTQDDIPTVNINF